MEYWIEELLKVFGGNVFLTSTSRNVAADWLEEQETINSSIVALFLKQNIVLNREIYGSGYGSGNGSGSGYGSGYGNGSGNGSGRGSGYGSGYGSGSGSGSGNGSGSGRGNGSGYGNGSGNGSGRGSGSGSGYGSGSGSGNIPLNYTKDIFMPSSGDYVCVRSYNQGVVWGFLDYSEGQFCRLKEPRQQYTWDENALTLMDVVMQSPDKTGVKLSRAGVELDMTEVCGIYKVPEELVEAFRYHPHS